MTEFYMVTTTIDDQVKAQALIRSIIESRLAACAQLVGPVTSTYWWQEQIEESQEWLCVFKTTQACYVGLEAKIKQLHSYDVPQIVAFPIAQGSSAYLHWLKQETKS